MQSDFHLLPDLLPSTAHTENDHFSQSPGIKGEVCCSQPCLVGSSASAGSVACSRAEGPHADSPAGSQGAEGGTRD